MAGGIDWVTKHFLFPTANRSIFSLPTWFIQLTDHRNYGMTFDIPFPQTLLLAITFLILLGLVVVLCTRKSLTWVEAIGIGLVIGGAIGNFMDRLLLGFVRDWLLFFHRSAINLADVAVLIGVILLLLHPHTSHQKETAR